jgi:cysteinyl-tRNA synthetase
LGKVKPSRYILESLGRLNQVLDVFRLQGCVPAGSRCQRPYSAAGADPVAERLEDEAREELAGKGIVIIDTENGPVWKKARDGE